jgi:hypothetical protein
MWSTALEILRLVGTGNLEVLCRLAALNAGLGEIVIS